MLRARRRRQAGGPGSPRIDRLLITRGGVFAGPLGVPLTERLAGLRVE
jgi:hypothetical protein